MVVDIAAADSYRVTLVNIRAPRLANTGLGASYGHHAQVFDAARTRMDSVLREAKLKVRLSGLDQLASDSVSVS